MNQHMPHAMIAVSRLRSALPIIGAVVVVFMLSTLLAYQLPLRTTIAIGQEDGYGADLPLVERFYKPEQNQAGHYRWSGERSLVQLPGVGSQALITHLRSMRLPAELVAQGPRFVIVLQNNQQIAAFPLREQGGMLHMLLPATTSSRMLAFVSTPYQAPGDSRQLGVPLSTLSLWRSGPGWPDPGVMAGWSGILLVLIGGAAVTGIRRVLLLVGGLVVVLLVGLATAFDPARTALAVRPFLIGLLAGWLLALCLRMLLPWLAVRLGIPLPGWVLGWMLLIMALGFALRYGAKFYPDAMPGDITFHANRFEELLGGRLLLAAPHRGVLSPYAPGPYLLLAPFTLLGFSPRSLLQVGAALVDTLSPLLIYVLGASTANHPASSRSDQEHAGRIGLLAASLYAFAPAGMLAHWWNFSTHSFTQAAMLLLLTIITLSWQSSRLRFPGMAGLVVAQMLVYLGHFGYWINSSLLIGLGLGLLMVLALAHRLAWQRVWPLVVAGGLAQVLAVGLFYSAYLTVLQQQTSTVGAGTATGVLHDPAALQAFVQSLLGEGLRDHAGLFPVVLAGCGLIVWFGQRTHRQSSVVVLALLSMLIGLGFALLPLVSGANLSPRWLTFTLWAIVVCAAPILLRLWHMGRAGRLLVITMSVYGGLISAMIWLEALAWRIRPPEPF